MKPIIAPTLKDPRLLLMIFFAILIFNAVSTNAFARTWVHIAVSAGICLSLDLLLGRVLDHKITLPISGFISSVGVFLLVDSPLLWPTALAATLAIFSKHFFRFRGQHIFNPANFGVLITCWAAPDWVFVGIYRWAGSVFTWAILFIIGTAIVVRVGRVIASYSYILTFLILSILRALAMHKSPWLFTYSLWGPAGQLFIFYMISDPRTSPVDRKRQLAYGVSVAVLDSFVRQMEWPNSSLIALMLICLLFNVYRGFRNDRKPFLTWKTREFRFGEARIAQVVNSAI